MFTYIYLKGKSWSHQLFLFTLLSYLDNLISILPNCQSLMGSGFSFYLFTRTQKIFTFAHIPAKYPSCEYNKKSIDSIKVKR